MENTALAHHIQVCYPQALTKLIYRYKNIVVAEDLLHEAVVKALINWQENIPENSVAWLVTVASNHFIDQARREKRFVGNEINDEKVQEIDLSEQALLDSYKDDLLRLIFTCCHPALNIQTQMLLTLKHVLGMSVAEIANALVQKDKTIEQRLTRAKSKITQANIPYQIPTLQEWPERIDAVLKVIYLYFNEGYFTSRDQKLVDGQVCQSAIKLTRILHSCIRDNAEVIGLLALLLHQNARLPARVDDKNNLVLLAEQNRKLWRQSDIHEANILVEKSLLLGGGTPYAIQSAIAALHNNANSSEQTDWQQIYALYLKLLNWQNSPVIELNAEIARAQFTSTSEAITRIEKLAGKLITYRHFYSALAALYLQENNFSKAKLHYVNALRFTKNDVETRFISQQIEFCQK